MAGRATAETPRSHAGAGGTPQRDPLSPRTHRLQQTDVLPQGADAAAEGDEEGEDAHHDQQDGGVHRQAGHRRLCRSECHRRPPQHPASPGGQGSPNHHPLTGTPTAVPAQDWSHSPRAALGGTGGCDTHCVPPQVPKPHLRASAAARRPPPPPSPSRSSAEWDRAGNCEPPFPTRGVPAPETDPLPQFPLVTPL